MTAHWGVVPPGAHQRLETSSNRHAEASAPDASKPRRAAENGPCAKFQALRAAKASPPTHKNGVSPPLTPATASLTARPPLVAFCATRSLRGSPALLLGQLHFAL